MPSLSEIQIYDRLCERLKQLKAGEIFETRTLAKLLPFFSHVAPTARKKTDLLHTRQAKTNPPFRVCSALDHLITNLLLM